MFLEVSRQALDQLDQCEVEEEPKKKQPLNNTIHPKFLLNQIYGIIQGASLIMESTQLLFLPRSVSDIGFQTSAQAKPGIYSIH